MILTANAANAAEERDSDDTKDEYDLYERRRDDRDFNEYDFPNEDRSTVPFDYSEDYFDYHHNGMYDRNNQRGYKGNDW